MKGMNNLIRIHKWKLDEKKRAISDMQNLLDGFQEQLTRLDHEQKAEQEVAADNFDTQFTYANYLVAAKQRRLNLLASIEDSEARIAEAQEEVAEIFQELKKYEVSEETRLRLLREQEDKRLQDEMDDLSIEMHRRKEH